MALLFVLCTSQILLFEFGLSNTVAQITRLEPLERDNQGSVPTTPAPPPQKNYFSVRLGSPDKRGFPVSRGLQGP